MAPCKLENKTIKIGETPNKKESLTFIGKHSKIIYDGYMKVMNMYKKNNSQISVDGEDGDTHNDNDNEDKIVQLYNQNIDSSDDEKVGYLDDDYDDIINLNDF